MTDPIADMLTRIRNAMSVRHKEVLIPLSGVKCEILKILKEEGYVKDYAVIEEGFPKKIKVQLKYSGNKSVITEIKRISKPGKRVYVGKDDVPKVMGGLGISILSTSKGILTDKTARKMGAGGEVICQVS